MNYEKMTVKQLKATASELGVLPKGRPNKKALIAALQPGGPPLESGGLGEQWKTPSQEVYQFDRMYRVKQPFSGYEKGDEVCNLARSLGLALVESGAIQLVESSPRKSNPHAAARVKPA